MSSAERVLLAVLVYVCAVMVTATAGLAYSGADVQRGEEMVATKDYKGAIELLLAVSKDLEFCSTSPIDAARAGMALCEAYEASGEKSDAYRDAADLTKVLLVQVWASLKRQEPDLRKRLERMATVCQGHPQAFADYLSVALPKLVAGMPKSEASSSLDVAMSLYSAALAATPAGRSSADAYLLLYVGKQYAALKEHKKTIELLAHLPEAIPEERVELRAEVLFLLVEEYALTSDSEHAVARAKQYMSMGTSGIQRAEVAGFLITSLERLGRVDEAVDVQRSLIADEKNADVRNELIAHIGLVYFEAKRYVDALHIYSELRKTPQVREEQLAQAGYYSGLCNYHMKRNAAACREMNAVAASYPGTEWARKARGQLYLWGELK